MTLTREQVEDLLNSLEERIAIPVLGYLNAQRAEIDWYKEENQTLNAELEQVQAEATERLEGKYITREQHNIIVHGLQADLAACQRERNEALANYNAIALCGHDHSTQWWELHCNELQGQLTEAQATIKRLENQLRLTNPELTEAELKAERETLL